MNNFAKSRRKYIPKYVEGNGKIVFIQVMQGRPCLVVAFAYLILLHVRPIIEKLFTYCLGDQIKQAYKTTKTFSIY